MVDPLTNPDDIDFLTKLQEKFFYYDPNSNPSGFAEQAVTGEGSVGQFDALLEAYGTMETDPELRKVFPRTWDDFVTQVRINGFGQGSAGDTRSGALYNGFLQEYLSILQVFGGDYTGIPTSELEAQFVESFTQFLKTYQFNVDKNPDGTSGPTDGAAGPTSFFISNFRTFMTVTAVNRTAFATGDTANVGVMQQIFQAFFPEGTEADFQALRAELIEEARAGDANGQNTYFIPSHFLHKWFEKVQDTYLTTQLGASSIKGTESESLSIIWRLFKLVVEMIGTLQKVASVVAERLNFLTRYQKAYTDLMATVPVFTKGDGSPFGGTDDDAASSRQELNPKNQTLTENLRSFRTIISDEAKALQSNVNQINESVNQQSSLADSILQQMSTILQSIYR